MVQPVTTTDILLAQVVDLLTEVRDLLPAAPVDPPAKKAAKKAAPARAAKKTSTTKS